jgi:hypothetical protein
MGLKTIWRCRYLLACTLLTPLVVQAQAPAAQQALQATATALDTSTPQRFAQPPALSASRQAALEAAVARKANLRLPMGEQVPVPESLALAAPSPAAETPSPMVPGGPLVFEANTQLAPGSAGLATSVVGEPSVAQSGGTVFYTGNWYAASSNADATASLPSYIDPSADMSDFCCDQDVVADRGRDMIIWSRLGIGGNGRFVLSRSIDQASTFCSWELNPLQLGYPNADYDQPLMALSNNNLYISANIFNRFAPFNFLHEVLLKISLDTLQDCPGGFGYNFWNVDSANGWGSLVQGATTTMYFGSHRGTNNSFTVYYNPESTGSLFSATVAIAPFTFQNRNSNCPIAGTNPCARSDSRVQTGWVRKGSGQTVGEVGFMWDAHEDANFPLPYIEAATFREDNFVYSSRPLLWFGTAAAAQYPGASPTTRGDVGLTMYLMGGTGNYFPGAAMYFNDDYGAAWSNGVFLVFGNGSANAWGDYVRNRPFLPTETGWTSAGHSIINGQVVPWLTIISRQRDMPAINRYLSVP